MRDGQRRDDHRSLGDTNTQQRCVTCLIHGYWDQCPDPGHVERSNVAGGPTEDARNGVVDEAGARDRGAVDHRHRDRTADAHEAQPIDTVTVPADIWAGLMEFLQLDDTRAAQYLLRRVDEEIARGVIVDDEAQR